MTIAQSTVLTPAPFNVALNARAQPEPGSAPQWRHPRQYQLEPGGQSFRVVELRTIEELSAHLAAWDDLALNALEPNVFYEPWLLLPALKAFGAGLDLRFLLLYSATETPVLCGFFPLLRQRGYKGLPLTITRCWRYKYAALCTPLIRAETSYDCLATFHDWLKHDSASGVLLRLEQINGDGLWQQLLTGYFNHTACPALVEESHTRAFFERATDSEDYLTAALSAQRRKYLRKQERRLERLGQVEYIVQPQAAPVETWLEQFLTLEAQGWKGRAGSALASNPASKQFFLEAMHEGQRRQRLLLLALQLDGQPIALKCCLRAGAGSFAFKIAYDEQYEHASPGWQLELATIRHLHQDTTIEWMDSCAKAQSFTNQVWPARRTIQTVLVATGKTGSDLLISTIPLLRWAKRNFTRNTPEES